MNQQTRSEIIKSHIYGMTNAEIATAQGLTDREVQTTLDAVPLEEIEAMTAYLGECGYAGN